jgi:hypothetical protein
LSFEELTLGGKQPRSPTLLDAPLDAANITLGTLLSVFQVAEPYKEIKDSAYHLPVLNCKMNTLNARHTRSTRHSAEASVATPDLNPDPAHCITDFTSWLDTRNCGCPGLPPLACRRSGSGRIESSVSAEGHAEDPSARLERFSMVT